MSAKKKDSLAIALFSLLGALMVGHAIYHYPLLPDRIAIHFGFAGTPDAWGSKTAFFFWYFVLTLIIVGGYALLQRTFSQKNTSWISIPNKEYWLEPERADETLDYLKRGLLLLGSGTLLFVLDLIHQSFQVSLGHASKLTHIWTSAGIYIVLCIAWIAGVYRRFASTPVS
ncbi:hypothetical protein CR161_07015 [Prosthecochloris sp. ZM]|uniref:DUF1648 domain-containing protein n=1 Tax=Prosthecochloris sp. ZM TaxID=2283143 RepID=UPI000DF8055A|nr:DUF1648 domain-containing protein [Prosthecochloris sp. ZM]RDD30482.1 hypothetical protein CR161_07015 [Prosthecochloris sp. ZM]